MNHKEVENMFGKICFLFFITKSIKTETVTLSPSPTVDVAVNSPLTLTCTTTYTMKFAYFFDSTLVSGNSAITLYENNGDCLKFTGQPGYTFTCDSGSGPYLFTITSVTREHHDSIITCTIQYGTTTSNEVASAVTKIKVNVPIVINELTPAGTVTKNLTDTQLFKCSASGFPKATITWDIDGSTATTMAPSTTSDSGEMVTSEITYVPQKTDNGKRITCTAMNRIGSASLSTALVIQYLPTVEVSPTGNRYNVIENTTFVNLKCTVKEANPNVTSYRWYKNDSIISTNSTYVIQKVFISHGGKYTCDASNEVGASNKSPELVLNVLHGVKVNSIDALQPTEGSILSINCTGESNPAIQDSDVTWTKQNNNTFTQMGRKLYINNVNRNDSGYYICNVVITLTSSAGQQVTVTGTTSVHVDVFYLPVVEMSPSYTQYNVLENTTNLQFQCIVKEANPNVTSYGWYNNGSKISSNATYNVPKVSRSVGGKITCDAHNTAGSSTRATEMVLNVLYGVKVDTINTQERLEGSILTINCTGESNPAIQDIDVTWTKQNNNTFIQTGKKLTIDNVDRMDSGSFICTIVLTLTPSDGNPLIISETTNFQLHVLYQPVVEIIPSFQTYNVIENTTNIHLNCTVQEAYPAVKSYLWKRDSKNISTNASLKIPFVQTSDRGNYTCYGFNKAGSSRPSSTLIVNVLYGVKVNTIDLQQPVEGSTFSVLCTGISNPPIEENEIVWTKKNDSTFKAHGKELLINDITRLDNGSFICTVKKSLTPSVGNIAVVTGTTTVTVDVLYLPLVEIVTNRNVIIQEYSTDLILTCFVKEANPEVKEYTWYKDGSLISQERHEKYKLNKVYRTDAGYYTCSGSNYIGSTNSTNLEVNVLYGVTLNLSRSRITVNESEQLSIVCAAVGNPLPTLSWINTYNNSVIIETDKVDTNSLTVNNANCIDTGVYTCVGNNSIGSVAFYSIAVNVKCQPRTVDNRGMRTIIVNGIGGVLSISEVFISYPSSDVHWLRQTQDDNNTVLNNQFESFDNKSIIPFGTISTLYKDVMTRDEFGTYIAIAVNNYGSYEVKYNVIPKGKPYPPTNVSAICGITSITVTWIPKFNGGDNQTFRIYFHNEDRNITTLSSGDKTDEGEGSHMKLREDSFIPNSFYEINVEARNNFGYTNSTEIVTCSTAKRSEKESTSLALTGGIAGTISSLLVVSVVVIIIFIIRRRKNPGDDKKTVTRCNPYTDEDEDGLKDNPLYGTSEQPANYGGGLINGSENTSTDTAPMVKGLDEGPVYSKVEKVGQKGKQKKHQKKLKNENHGQHNKDIEMGTVYENSDKLLKVKAEEEVYENAPTDNDRVQIVDTTDQCKSQKNKDGLVYADLDLAPQPSGKRFVIRGLENRNNYAIIDLSKTAEPLPSDSDEEDTAKTNTITKEDN